MVDQVIPSGNTTISISGPGGAVTVSSPTEKLQIVQNAAISLADRYHISQIPRPNPPAQPPPVQETSGG
jgi:hypothetical protein